MALTTYTVTIADGTITTNEIFAFTVPGQYQWRVLSVLAHADRQAGGTGVRTYDLALASGALPVLDAAAIDNANDPGVLTVCWANITAANTVLTTDGAMTIPFPDVTIPAGYILTGTIELGIPGDFWVDAVVWVDQTAAG